MGVQGDQGKFQVRPDLLLWRITDWSGGEGQVKFTAADASRHLELQNVDPFDEPGKLKPGRNFEVTTFAAAATFDHTGMPVRAMGGLWLVSVNDNKVYEWDDSNSVWLAADTNSGQTGGAAESAVHGDGNALYYLDRTDPVNAWSFDGTTWTQIDDAAKLNEDTRGFCGLGAYVYAQDWITGQVWEIDKGGVSTTSIDEPGLVSLYTGTGLRTPPNLLVAGDNKVYSMIVTSGATVVREITPTNAAGPGFGAQIATFPGFEVDAGWWSNGTLFLVGDSDQHSAQKAVMYIRPGESFGSLGRVRPRQTNLQASGAEDNGNMLLSGFITRRGLASTEATVWKSALWLVDAVSGGMCAYCVTSTAAYDDFPLGPVYYRGDWFWGSAAATNKKTWKTSDDTDTTEKAFATSPIHDFDLADEKVLSSIRVVTEGDVPANWDIRVYYGLDTNNPDTLATTMTSADGNDKSVAITTAATPVVFNHLSIRIEIENDGAGGATGPKILQVEARAQLAETPKRWRLLLDCRDQQSAGVSSYNGAKKLEKLRTAIAKKTVALIDGYYSHDPKTSTTHDVIIDSYRIVLTKPGEGYAYIELVEVL